MQTRINRLLRHATEWNKITFLSPPTSPYPSVSTYLSPNLALRSLLPCLHLCPFVSLRLSLSLRNLPPTLPLCLIVYVSLSISFSLSLYSPDLFFASH